MATGSPQLTHERVQHRYETLLEAFLTADRRRRGTLPFDRVSEIYSLYFHSSSGQLGSGELPALLQDHTSPGGAVDGVVGVDYMAFAEAVRKRETQAVKRAEAASRRAEERAALTAEFAAPSPSKLLTELHLSPSRGGGGGGGGDTRWPLPPPPAEGGGYGTVPPGGPWPGTQPHDASGGLPMFQSPYAPAQVSPYAQQASPPYAPSHASPYAPSHASPYALPHASPYAPAASPYAQSTSPQTASHHPLPAAGLSPTRRPANLAAEAAAADAAASLLAALQQQDSSKTGLVTSAQLMMMCRLHGVNEDAGMLRSIMSAISGDRADGLVDYITFLQQLAALTAAAGAHASLAHLKSPNKTRGGADGADGAAGEPSGVSRARVGQAGWGGPALARGPARAADPAKTVEQLYQAFANADHAHSGELPVSEVRRLCAIYQLKATEVQIERLLTAAVAQAREANPQRASWHADSQLVQYDDFLHQLIAQMQDAA